MADNAPEAETLEQMQARHRKEAKDLQGRITSKKKNATKKTRKGVNDECAEMERAMKERHAEEQRQKMGSGGSGDAEDDDDDDDDDESEPEQQQQDTTPPAAAAASKQTPPPPPQQQETGATNGGKSKRNRQKERLARRAAAVSAASLAAEAEASHMTDHRARERAALQSAFAAHGLVEREIAPDGHCLFAAVADQLNGTAGAEAGGGQYKEVRRRAAEYIGAHADLYAGFLEEDVDAYVAKIRDTAEWGGQIELAALANVYGVEVAVVQDGGMEVVKPMEEDNNNAADGGQERKRIWLAYYRHGYGLGEHYNSLRKKEA